MLHLELSEAECKELRHILENYLSHLSLEIRHTHHREFKEILRRREQMITNLLERLGQPVEAA